MKPQNPAHAAPADADARKAVKEKNLNWRSFFDGGTKFIAVRFRAWAESCNRFARTIQEEFLEVPADIARTFGRKVHCSQMFVQLALIIAVYIDFAQHVKVHAVILLAEGCDFF